MSSIKAYLTCDPALGAPNPRVVDMFAAEKGIDLASKLQVIDLPGLKNRSPETYAMNPTGTVPFVELSDGSFVSETIAICELMEEETPEPCLFGATPSERATTRMWQRRVEQHICLPIISGLRWGPAKEFFAPRGMHGQLANDEASEQQFAVSKSQLKWLDDTMLAAGSTPYICGDRYTIADLQLYTFLSWALSEGGPQPDVLSDESLKWVPGWYERISERAAAVASDPARAAVAKAAL